MVLGGKAKPGSGRNCLCSLLAAPLGARHSLAKALQGQAADLSNNDLPQPIMDDGHELECAGNRFSRLPGAVQWTGVQAGDGRGPGSQPPGNSGGLAVATLICRASDYPIAEIYRHIPPNAEPVCIYLNGQRRDK